MGTPKVRISVQKLAVAYVENCGSHLKAINTINELINSRRKREVELRKELSILNQDIVKYLQIKEVIKLDI